ncbi:MAG: S8 family serine peptidase [Vulcanimicrobiota bacterium]
MNIGSRNPWESPTQYVGRLPTTGKGVGVVVMDEGFDLSHPDLKGNVVGVATTQGDVFDGDPLGHGTHTLGIVAGNGGSSNGAVRGIAPEATLFAMKVKLAQGEGLAESIDSINRGMHWVVANKEKYNIRVVNCSFVLPTLEQTDPKTGAIIPIDPLAYALNLAREAGISVVAGVGNFADKSPIATPAGNPDVIAVGALDTNQTPEDPSDDKVADFSSRGLSIHGTPKPDILAPGVSIMSTNSTNSQSQLQNALLSRLPGADEEEAGSIARQLLPERFHNLPAPVQKRLLNKLYEVKPVMGENGSSPAYITQSGSSESAPIVAGVVAHMYEANPRLTPSQVKEILSRTARPVEGDPVAVGAGALNAQAAVAAALALKE